MFGIKREPSSTVRILMAEYDLNTQELAHKTGLTPQTISGIRTGRTKNPNSDTKYLIAQAFGVKPNYIWPNA